MGTGTKRRLRPPDPSLLLPALHPHPQTAVSPGVWLGSAGKGPGCQHSRLLPLFLSRSPVPAGRPRGATGCCPSARCRGHPGVAAVPSCPGVSRAGGGLGGSPALSCGRGRARAASTARPAPVCGPRAAAAGGRGEVCIFSRTISLSGQA